MQVSPPTEKAVSVIGTPRIAARLSMCDVCGCKLPINRSGHVTREIRRTHKAGAKHQAALARRAEEHERAAEANLRRLEREWAEGARQRRAACIHALTLGLLITRLRAKHGSMAEARKILFGESQSVFLRGLCSAHCGLQTACAVAWPHIHPQASADFHMNHFSGSFFGASV